jgi:hypothetical protein
LSYITESSSWRDRKRHRQQLTLLVILALIVVAGGIGYAVYSGVIGGPDPVDVTTLPPCPTATAKPMTPDRVVVNVYNATRRGGLAASAATSLDRRSFQVRAIANDPLAAKVPGTAVVRHGSKGLAQAQLVAAQVAGAKLVKDKRRTAVVDLVLGTKYQGLKTLAQTTPTPQSTPSCRPATATSTATSTATPTAKSPLPKVTTKGRTPDTRTTTTS